MIKDLENEKDAIDIVTDSMFSLGFLKDFSDCVFEGHGDKFTVKNFYDQWTTQVRPDNLIIPFNLGIITSYLYTGILLTKERWDALIPDDATPEALAEWSLSGVVVTAPMKPAPTVKYIIRRIRNALGHGNIKIDVPEDAVRERVLDQTKYELFDVSRDPNDTFLAVASVNSLIGLVKKLQSVAHSDIRSRL
ncbi:TPA: HEPN family nuclease [Pseudomonas putida]